MRRNLANWERMFRYVLGIALLTWAFVGGPFWAFAGFYPLITSSWGFCPGYFVLRSLRNS